MRRFLLGAALVFLLSGARQRATRPPATVGEGPTFSKEIVRIFQQHCQTCHHPGDIAPFSLTNYAEAKENAAMIRFMTRTRRMPPWKPAPGCGDFAGSRGLTQQEIDLIAKWVDAGAPEGNAADLPPPIDFGSGWTLGQPDMILSSPEPFTPKAEGDTYRCFSVPTNLTSDQFVAAVDVHPGDRKTVHHVIAFIDTTGVSVSLDEREPGPGYTCFGGPGFLPGAADAATLGGWAPGYRGFQLPQGVAMRLPAASRLVLQVHYHPHDGAPQPDRTEVGLYFSKQKPSKLLRFLPIINTTFTIPPGHPNYEVLASAPLPMLADTHAIAVGPHMHLLGKKMRVEAILPTGERRCLIDIDDWDFNWQAMYRFKEPVAIPFLSRLVATAVYDNSADNPNNPNNPPKAVSWGEATTDEMCIAFIGYTIDSENLN